MKKALVVMSTAVAVSTFAVAQSLAPSPEQQVRQANQEFFQAVETLDVTALNHVLADDAVFSNGGARTETKAEVLAQVPRIRQHTEKSKFANTNIFRVTMHGETAIVVGRQWRPSDKPGGERFIFTNIFAKRNNNWQIIEVTRMAESP